MIDFGLTDQQEALQRSARAVLAAECPPELVRATAEGESGVPRPLYGKLAELGYFGIRVPERFGGLGLETLDLALVLEELGRVCAPGPFLATQLVIDGLLAGGSAAQKRRWLPKLAAGEALGALVLDGTDPTTVDVRARGAVDLRTRRAVDVRARRAKGGWMLDGRATYVLEAPGADLLLVAARLGGKADPLLFFVLERERRGVRIRQHELMDLTRRFATVELRNVLVTEDERVGKREAGRVLADRLVDLACVGIAADSFGGAQQAIEMAVDYAKVREQFGRTIGSFQAVKHIAAEMVADVEPLRSLCWYAAWVQDHRPKEASRLAAMAKAALGDVYSRTARRSVEIHGGIGFTWEFDLHLWFKRAHVSESLFGDPSRHRERVAVLEGY